MSHSHGHGGHDHDHDHDHHDHGGMDSNNDPAPLSPEAIAALPLGEQVAQAAAAGACDVLRGLMQRFGEQAVAESQDEDGSTGLHWACLRDRYDAVKLLLDSGAGVNVGNHSEGATPLMWAVINGNLRITHHLVDSAGASTTIRDKRGYDCVHHGAQHNQVMVIHYLLSQCRMDVDSRDSLGHTPLMWAAYMNHEETLTYFIQHGADINATDSEGSTSLHWAAVKGNLRSLKALLDAGADWRIEDRSPKRRKPIDLAQDKEFQNIVRVLRLHADTQKAAYLNVPSWTIQQREYFWFGYAWVFSLVLLLCLSQVPYLILGLLIFVGFAYLSKLFLFPLWLSDHNRNPMWSGITLSVYVYSAAAYFLHVFPVNATTQTTLTTLFMISNFVFFPTWVWLIRSEPGTITPERMAKENGVAPVGESVDAGSEKSAVAHEWSAFLSALDAGEKVRFCVSCDVRRPLRSKHCKSCHKCVARFDHHCVWINRCVGIDNILPFCFELFLVFTMHISFISLTVKSILAAEDSPSQSLFPLNVTLPYMFEAAPFLMALVVFHCQNLGWQGFLMFQMGQNISEGITMNERINMGRYDYLKDFSGGFSNPFNKGAVANITDFLSPRDNWFTIFNIRQSRHAQLQRR